MNRRYSLRGRAMFARLYRDGSTIRGASLSLRYLPESSDVPKFGFSAKREVGSAVARNRLKRLFKEAVRSEINAWAPGLYHLRIGEGIQCSNRTMAAAALQSLRGLLNG